jgi:hypothetical protein
MHAKATCEAINLLQFTFYKESESKQKKNRTQKANLQNTKWLNGKHILIN